MFERRDDNCELRCIDISQGQPLMSETVEVFLSILTILWSYDLEERLRCYVKKFAGVRFDFATLAGVQI